MNTPEQRPTQTGHKQLYRLNAWCSGCMGFVVLKKVTGGWECEHCGHVDNSRVWVKR